MRSVQAPGAVEMIRPHLQRADPVTLERFCTRFNFELMAFTTPMRPARRSITPT